MSNVIRPSSASTVSLFLHLKKPEEFYMFKNKSLKQTKKKQMDV